MLEPRSGGYGACLRTCHGVIDVLRWIGKHVLGPGLRGLRAAPGRLADSCLKFRDRREQHRFVAVGADDRGHPTARRSDIERSIRKLADLGFYRLVPGNDRAATMWVPDRAQYILDEETHLVFEIDLENLYECGVRGTISKMCLTLQQIGAPVLTFDDRGSMGGGYWATINGIEYTIRTDEEDARGSKSCNSWGLSTERTLSMLARHLSDAGVPERLYASFPDDPQLVAFLTPAMFEAIMETGDTSREIRELHAVVPDIETRSAS